MSNNILFFDVDQSKIITQFGAPLLAKPIISYQAQPIWEIHFVKIDSIGMLQEVDLSDAVSWRGAADIDFDSKTDPMIRTLDENIDSSKKENGVIAVALDANTTSFFNKIDKKSQVTAVFQLRGINSNGKIVYDFSFDIICKGAVDPFGIQPLPVVDGVAEQEWVLGLLRAALEYRFSEDNENWHDERLQSDIYFQSRFHKGEWSESILIVNGEKPVKGVDYFTSTEIAEFTEEIKNSINETDPIYTADKPNIALKSQLFSGSYNDLSDKPELYQPESSGDGRKFLADDGTYKTVSTGIVNETDPIYTADKPNIALKSQLFSGSYNDLSDKPNIALKSQLFSGSYNDLSDKPELYQPVTTGNGTKFLADDGTYKTVSTGGSGGAVTSVNGMTGDVVISTELTADEKQLLLDELQETMLNGRW